jgi:peptide/nickel transport system ATP-binding protein
VSDSSSEKALIESPVRAVSSEALLEVRDLSVSLVTDGGQIQATSGVSFDVPKRTVVAIVGESGCGKTITAHSLLRILPAGATIDSGSIRLGDVDLVTASEKELRSIRGGRIGIVFQEPMTSLNPVITIGAQIVEAIRLHADVGRSEAKKRAIDWLVRVGMPEPERRFHAYAHELSGGMRQRALIAMALAPGPELLVADEPTTALDRSIEAQILTLIEDLVRSEKMSLLYISHDFAVVSNIADHIVVMYAGEVVEEGPTDAILTAPKHPYTQALLESVLDLDALSFRERGKKRRPLMTIEGSVPDLRSVPRGCRFVTRCPKRMGRCADLAVPVFEVAPSKVRCWLYDAPTATTSSKRALVLEDEPQASLELEDDP